MGSIFTVRNFVGALLFMILVGEFQLGFVDKVLSIFGVVLYIMYFAIFLLFEAIVNRYRLVNYQIFLLGFAIYAVLITGFIHAEISNYVLQPQNDVITTLIRIQSSLYIFFAYLLLNRFFPRKPSNKPVKLWLAVLIFAAYVLILTPSKSYGLIAAASVFYTAPAEALLFGILGIVALYLGLRSAKPGSSYNSRKLVYLSALFVVIAIIPSVLLVVPYYLLMIVASALLLLSGRFRNGPLLT